MSNKVTVTTKIYPSNSLSGKGFFYDKPNGNYIGDIKHVINDNITSLTEQDKTNYVLKELFEYVNTAGKSDNIFGRESNIDKYFISYNNTTDIIPKIHKRNEVKTGGKRMKSSKKNRKTRKNRKSTKNTKL
jgi:hypothetical protein